MKDLVSIIIPVYNGSNYLRYAIDSALSQNYEHTEVLVVNDGSDDGGATEAIALEYGDKIRYFLKSNGGVSSALNLGITEAHGEWVSWLSHDDIYAPDKIARQMSAIEESPSEGAGRLICLCGSMFIGANGEILPKRVLNKTKRGIYSSEEMLVRIAQGFSIGGCGMLVPRTAFDRVGFFDESLRYVQDVDMWIRLFAAGYGLLYLPQYKLVSTRIHAEQGQSVISHLWQPESKVYTERFARILLKLDEGPSLVRSMARRCYLVGDYAGGDSALRILRDEGEVGIDPIKACIYKLRGHCRQVVRCVYHRICHGFNR